jgi:hypothetical protein
MCQLCQVGCEQKLHEMEESKKKKSSHSHIDGRDQYVLFFTAIIATQTPKHGQGMSIP